MEEITLHILIKGAELQQWLPHFSLTYLNTNTRGSWHLLAMRLSKYVTDRSFRMRVIANEFQHQITLSVVCGLYVSKENV